MKMKEEHEKAGSKLKHYSIVMDFAVYQHESAMGALL